MLRMRVVLRRRFQILSVVPANAGTHNPREEFGEAGRSGFAPRAIDKFRGMGPCFRRDDTGECR
ncbi:hypothetical protein B5V03_06380 [Bradyrhizobium betae]|uniref:Uncharacterized protein n=1 Tax=Bradyrhizobium betae TaxID=244734 RepID=A0A4Q1VHA8_9BRAD|nr:hypothetical protein B5V03_06380 [Bradyrhizobium betae]